MKININKKGTYIVEATICLPIMIIAITVMASVILYYACIEDAQFIMATESRRAAIESRAANVSVILPARVSDRVKDNNSHITSCAIRSIRYRDSVLNNDEMIALTMRLKMNSWNPIGISAESQYDMTFITRAYVGKIRDNNPMSADEFMSDGSDVVYIFPKDGERYHKKDCTFVKAGIKQMILTEDVRQKYAPCPICHSKAAGIGSKVIVFPAYGESYHMEDCDSVNRKFVEVEEKTAIERGYTACSKCGGK